MQSFISRMLGRMIVFWGVSTSLYQGYYVLFEEVFFNVSIKFMPKLFHRVNRTLFIPWPRVESSWIELFLPWSSIFSRYKHAQTKLNRIILKPQNGNSLNKGSPFRQMVNEVNLSIDQSITACFNKPLSVAIINP